jgi:hypothetical protein
MSSFASAEATQAFSTFTSGAANISVDIRNVITNRISFNNFLD